LFGIFDVLPMVAEIAYLSAFDFGLHLFDAIKEIYSGGSR
jgi:hypothetical protein